MILWIYNKLWLIAYPFLKLYIRKRSKKYPIYSYYLNERFNESISNPVKNAIWIHAVSVGEIKSAEPIIKLLLNTFSEKQILITSITPTGKKVADGLLKGVQNRYLPYDNLKYVKNFLNDHNPKVAIFMEKEIWPNYLIECFKRKIPIYLANARISNKSYNYYSKFPKTINNLISKFKFIFVQSEKDLVIFKKLGADNIKVTGNTKYDVSIGDGQYILSKDLKEKIGARKVIVFGSTRFYRGNDENKLLINEILKSKLDVLFIIVPRHPEFFEDTYQYAKNLGIKVQKRSICKTVDLDTKILIGDTLGQMYSYYLISDIVFVGGSLVDSGCQNIIEPLACGIPTIFGFSTYNFEYVCNDAKENGCVIQVFTPKELFAKLALLLEDKRKYNNMKKNIINYVNANKGSSNKIVNYIINDLKVNNIKLML